MGFVENIFKGKNDIIDDNDKSTEIREEIEQEKKKIFDGKRSVDGDGEDDTPIIAKSHTQASLINNPETENSSQVNLSAQLPIAYLKRKNNETGAKQSFVSIERKNRRNKGTRRYRGAR